MKNFVIDKLYNVLKNIIKTEYSVGAISEQAINSKVFQEAELIVTTKEKTNITDLPHVFMGFKVVYVVGEL